MDILEIPVEYKNEAYMFKAHVVRAGYGNHIIVDLNGIQVTIERDEEGNDRALTNLEEGEDQAVDVHLVEKVLSVLQSR